MTYNNQYPIRELPPKALLYFLLIVGLVALTYAIITQNLIMAAAITSCPLASIILIYGLQNPRFGYLLYATYAYYFMVIMRFRHVIVLYVYINLVYHYSQKV